MSDQPLKGVHLRGRARWAALVIALLLAAGAGYALWTNAIYDQFPWQEAPDQITFCRRDYGHTPTAIGAGPFSLDRIVEEGNVRIGDVRTLHGTRELWGSAGAFCGYSTGVYLRVGPDRFLGYGMVGGP